MQKIKMTKKAIMDGFDNIIEIPYCNAQHLLSRSQPSFYTCGVYGWNANVYEIYRNKYGHDTVIVTGYRPFGNIHPKYDLVRQYDQRAKAILEENRWGDYEKTNELLWDLVIEFVEAVIE